MQRMKGKTVIVTGGGKGIGLGISTKFAQEGANLVLTGRQESALKETKEKLEKEYGIQVVYSAGDLGKEENAKKVVETAIEAFGGIDVLINNAQASKSGTLLQDHSKEDFDLAINSGLYATFFMMRESFPYLKESQGSIINFGSGAALAGKEGQSSYAAAKEGIRGLSRVAATEWGQYNININIICPLVMTPQLEKWKEDYPELYAKTIQGVPMRRFADAQQDIGGVCVFLASPEAKYITGETITMQGGSGLRP